MENSQFLFLCQAYKQEDYKVALKDSKANVTFYDDLEKLLKHCIDVPPSGVFVDLSTSMRNKSNKLASTLDNLNTTWPVLRCNVGRDGSVIVMPAKGEEKPTSIDKVIQTIHLNKDEFKADEKDRIYMRADVTCRIQMHKLGEKNWRRGNITSLCTAGSYVVSYDPPEVGEVVRLKIMDITETPIDCKGKVAWVRRWDEGTQLPGIGLTFDRYSIASPHKQALVDFVFNSITKKL